jgi:hypothetical protein
MGRRGGGERRRCGGEGRREGKKRRRGEGSRRRGMEQYLKISYFFLFAVVGKVPSSLYKI